MEFSREASLKLQFHLYLLEVKLTVCGLVGESVGLFVRISLKGVKFHVHAPIGALVLPMFGNIEDVFFKFWIKLLISFISHTIYECQNICLFVCMFPVYVADC